MVGTTTKPTCIFYAKPLRKIRKGCKEGNGFDSIHRKRKAEAKYTSALLCVLCEFKLELFVRNHRKYQWEGRLDKATKQSLIFNLH